jgi:hypothetical protein
MIPKLGVITGAVAGSGRAGRVGCRSSPGGQVKPGRNDRVDGVQDVGGQDGVRGGQIRGQVFGGPRPDQGAGDGGVCGDEAERELDHGQAGLFGDLGEPLDRVQSCPVGRTVQVETLRHHRLAAGGRLASGADRAGQPARGQRAPHQHANPVLFGDRQHVALHTALQDRVARLLADVSAQPVLAGGPLRLDDPVGGEGGGTEVADLAGALQVGQRGQGLLVAGSGSQRWIWYRST